MHEDLNPHVAIRGSSDRAFGLTVGAILAAIAAGRWYFSGVTAIVLLLFVAGIALILCGTFAPGVLAPLNRAWLRLGLWLAHVVNPLVLGLIYFSSVVPTGLLMRLLGRDLLRLKFDRTARSYWIVREPVRQASESFREQF